MGGVGEKDVLGKDRGFRGGKGVAAKNDDWDNSGEMEVADGVVSVVGVVGSRMGNVRVRRSTSTADECHSVVSKLWFFIYSL